MQEKEISQHGMNFQMGRLSLVLFVLQLIFISQIDRWTNELSESSRKQAWSHVKLQEYILQGIGVSLLGSYAVSVYSEVISYTCNFHGPLTRCEKFRVAQASFPPLPPVNDPNMHHGTWVTHVPWCMSGSLTSGFLWSQWRGKRSRHSRRMRNLQFCVSGKRPNDWYL